MKIMKLLFASVTVGVLGVAGLAAQSTPDQQFMASLLRKNQEELRKYSWKSKHVYSIDDIQKRVAEYSEKYFSNGTKQKMEIGRQVDKEKVRRANGKKLKKKEREAAYQFVMEVQSQFDTYLNPLFAEKAVATATMTNEGDTLILRSQDVVTNGDSVEIRFVLPDELPTTAIVTTTVEGSPVSLTIEFDKLEAGPVYPKRSTTKADWQEFHLEVTTENSDYEREKRW